MKCSFCLQPLMYMFRVKELIHFQTNTLLCHKCKEKLQQIQQPACSFCCLPLEKEICVNCAIWRKDESTSLKRNVSIYLNEGLFQELFVQYKIMGDYVLHKLFHEDIQKAYITHFFHYHDMVIVPSHPSSISKKGFHHLLPLIQPLPIKTHQIIEKVQANNQKELSVEQRLTQSNFVLTGTSVPKKVLLFDDIYTTGASVMACAKLLKMYGAEEISSLTIGRTPKKYQ